MIWCNHCIWAHVCLSRNLLPFVIWGSLKPKLKTHNSTPSSITRYNSLQKEVAGVSLFHFLSSFKKRKTKYRNIHSIRTAYHDFSRHKCDSFIKVLLLPRSPEQQTRRSLWVPQLILTHFFIPLLLIFTSLFLSARWVFMTNWQYTHQQWNKSVLSFTLLFR